MFTPAHLPDLNGHSVWITYSTPIITNQLLAWKKINIFQDFSLRQRLHYFAPGLYGAVFAMMLHSMLGCNPASLACLTAFDSLLLFLLCRVLINTSGQGLINYPDILFFKFGMQL